MIMRKRISNKRQKRPHPHLGRVPCCIDFLNKPPCITSWSQIIGRDVLIAYVSGGSSAIQQGVYTFGCIFPNCVIRWISPDTSDIFQIQSDGTAVITRAGLGAGAIDGTPCNAKPAVSISDTGFNGDHPTFFRWVCEGIPIRLDRRGLGLASDVYDATLLP